MKPSVNVVWEALPHTSQCLAVDTRAHETLYCGTRGCGKTDVQVMLFRKFVGRGYGKFWRGIIFDREYRNLDDMVSRTKRWYTKFGDGVKFLENKADYKWVWPTGEELLFRAVKKEDDYWDYHGQEFPFIGWNELTKYNSDVLYDAMMSCNRSSFTPEKDAPKDTRTGKPLIGKIPLMVFSTTNPWGVGHSWVKKRFIDPAPYGTVIRETTTVYNPQEGKRLPFTATRVAVFGSYKENIYLDAQYVAKLEAIKNKNKRKAWLEGSWEVAAGGIFEDQWDSDVHVVPNFTVPSGWKVMRGFDWGSSAPFYVGWFAVADGTEVKLSNGKFFAPARGSLILCWEWYGRNSEGKGLQLGPKRIAEGINEIEQLFTQAGITAPGVIVSPGPADGQIYNRINTEQLTIADAMTAVGVKWARADKSQGSRLNGLELIRERLRAALTGEGKALYFMQRCRGMITTVPMLPQDPDNLDDVDTTAEDHPYDVLRYAVLHVLKEYIQNITVEYPA